MALSNIRGVLRFCLYYRHGTYKGFAQGSWRWLFCQVVCIVGCADKGSAGACWDAVDGNALHRNLQGLGSPARWVCLVDSDAATPVARVGNICQARCGVCGPTKCVLLQVLLMSVVLLPLCTH